MRRHPLQVLFSETKPLPFLPLVDHYAGSEKQLLKALSLQTQLGPIFDITGDCEDGAPVGAEAEHALMIARCIASPDNLHARLGARIHDAGHACWRQDIELLLAEAGQKLAFLTLPKARSVEDVALQIKTLRQAEAKAQLRRQIPVHVLIETHGALRDVWKIAALPGVESLDFGLMDFVSAHAGAIPDSAMRSPGQFEHPLIIRAKAEISAAALANGVIPTHNVSTELKDLAVVRNDALRARQEFGYLRMWSIHPQQVLAIVEAMRPDFSSLQLAGEILLAAQDADWGPIRYAERLHDRASYRYYWSLLSRAKASGMALPAEMIERFFAVQDD
ncbi:MAG: aldolase/citrate lyase family protein [Pseudomonadota bacterium]